MAVFRLGDRGEDIKILQEKLQGWILYPGPIDGIYGPQTEAAVRAWQEHKGLTIDGIAGPETLGSLGLAHLGQAEPPVGGEPAPPSYNPYPSGPAYGPGGGFDPQTWMDALGDPTEDENLDTRFVGVAGNPEVWKNSTTGRYFVVYYVPDVQPKIPMLYEIPGDDKQVQQRLGVMNPDGDSPIKPDKTFSQQQINGFGGIEFGTVDMLPKTGHPFTAFAYEMERMKETMPWLADPEVAAIYANAAAQNRPVEPWELEGTDWYQTRTEGERDWLWLQMRDPQTAEQIKNDNRIAVYDDLRELGITEPPSGLTDYIADKLTTGVWTSSYVADQLKEITGISTSSGLDSELASWMEGQDIGTLRTKDYWTTVRNEFDRWLGPNFAPDNAQIRTWADKFRTNADVTADELTEYLRRQRVALFPEYQDDSLTYDDIAEPWRNFTTQIWGQRMSETDPLFSKILKMNDADEASKVLRKEGLNRGIGQVEQDALRGIFASVGQVRSPA